MGPNPTALTNIAGIRTGVLACLISRHWSGRNRPPQPMIVQGESLMVDSATVLWYIYGAVGFLYLLLVYDMRE